MENENSNNIRRTSKEINQERKAKQKKKLRIWLIISIIIIFIIDIVAFFIYWNVDNKSEKGQIDDFDKAIQNKDADKLSKIVKIKGEKLPKSDANRMINYLNQKNNQSRYHKQNEEFKNTI